MGKNKIEPQTRDFFELKKENIMTQKKGLPFMMASVVIWACILIVQITIDGYYEKNLATFCCSCLLMPLAILGSKIVKANIFAKNGNPFDKLGFRLTMTQMLYILIPMWAFKEHPDKMVMLYAIVFAAHLFPFSWLYDSGAYFIAGIVEAVMALILCLRFGVVVMAAFMLVAQIIVVIVLFTEIYHFKSAVRSDL
ncbi:MAG: hypothetical protein K5669_05860 [Lachnospiraceae bacterium]|nr:hypothetical protein [Lachnospiraceae bacterium]